MAEVEWGGEVYYVEYVCDVCSATFDTARQLRGHKVGKHGNKRPPRGPEHHAWKKKIDHGTHKGYMQEWRRGLTPCPQCKAAHAKYMADLKERSGAKR